MVVMIPFAALKCGEIVSPDYMFDLISNFFFISSFGGIISP
jgi:hypothetical protein